MGTTTRAPHLGHMARLPPRNDLTFSLCPLGHKNLMPIFRYRLPSRAAGPSSHPNRRLLASRRQARSKSPSISGPLYLCHRPWEVMTKLYTSSLQPVCGKLDPRGRTASPSRLPEYVEAVQPNLCAGEFPCEARSDPTDTALTSRTATLTSCTIDAFDRGKKIQYSESRT